MHELSLAESVRDIVEATALSSGAQRVVRVRLEIGRLAQVEPDAMRFAFDAVKRGSVFEDAALELVEVDGAAWCLGCAATVALGQRGEPCPRCGAYELKVSGGDRMRVLDIDIE